MRCMHCVLLPQLACFMAGSLVQAAQRFNSQVALIRAFRVLRLAGNLAARQQSQQQQSTSTGVAAPPLLAGGVGGGGHAVRAAGLPELGAPELGAAEEEVLGACKSVLEVRAGGPCGTCKREGL